MFGPQPSFCRLCSLLQTLTTLRAFSCAISRISRATPYNNGEVHNFRISIKQCMLLVGESQLVTCWTAAECACTSENTFVGSVQLSCNYWTSGGLFCIWYLIELCNTVFAHRHSSHMAHALCGPSAELQLHWSRKGIAAELFLHQHETETYS